MGLITSTGDNPLLPHWGALSIKLKNIKENKLFTPTDLKTQYRSKIGSLLVLLFFALTTSIVNAQCPTNYQCTTIDGKLAVTFQFDAGNTAADQNVACDFVVRHGGSLSGGNVENCTGGFIIINGIRYDFIGDDSGSTGINSPITLTYASQVTGDCPSDYQIAEAIGCGQTSDNGCLTAIFQDEITGQNCTSSNSYFSITLNDIGGCGPYTLTQSGNSQLVFGTNSYTTGTYTTQTIKAGIYILVFKDANGNESNIIYNHVTENGTCVTPSNLFINKTITSGDPYSAVGDIINYQYTVTSNVSITSPVVFDDRIGTLTTYTGDTNMNGILESTETWIFTGMYTITQDDIEDGSVTNNAFARGKTSLGQDIFSDVDDATATLRPCTNPTAEAGDAQSICIVEGDETVQLAGSIGGGATSSTWISSGTGSFDDNTSVNAVYTPSAADITAGSVTLTLTTNDPAGPCDAASDTVVISFSNDATAEAGDAQSICIVEGDETVQLAGSIGGGATSSTWISSGTGSFDDNTSVNAVYTPSAADITAGSVTLTLTTNDPAGPCDAASDTVVISFSNDATAEAGDAQSICIVEGDETVQLAGSIGGGATSSTWISSGTGSFDDNTSVNAVYTPSAADITAGSVTLTLTTNDPAGPCDAASDTVVISFSNDATAEAGDAQSICIVEGDETVQLAGSIGGGATSSTWISSGTGSFDDNTSVNAVYTPSAADITAGSVTLTLTTNDPAGPCDAASDTVVISFSNDATAEAGDAQSICIVEGDETVQLAGSIGGGATSSTWISSGTGSFDDNTSVNAVYTPSAADITAGSVTLTLTTNDPAGPCDAASDTVVISFSNDATAEAGDAQSICIVEGDETVQLAGSIGGGATSSTWISSGTGSFDDNTSVNAVYTPSAADITAGSVTLTLTTNDPAGPCDAASDTVVISFSNDATAEAGDAQSICIVEGDETVQLAGSIGGGATSSTWISSGTGSFDDNTSVNAVYTPSAADITAGSVTLTLTTNDPAGPCDAASDTVVISFSNDATAEAGDAQSICIVEGDETVQLAGSIGGGATSSTWISSGTGSFDDNTSVNAVYTPSAADITAGSVTLTLTTNDPAGPCDAASDTVVISFSNDATAEAGDAQSICIVEGDETVQLAGSIGGGATSSTWISSGTGSFDDNTSVNAVYTPSAADITAGSVTLTLTTNDPAGPCDAASDTVVISFSNDATAEAGDAQSICIVEGDETVQLAGSIGGGATSSTWISSGTGSFDDNTSVNAVYTPSAADITAGSVTLTLTTNDPAGPCDAASDTVVISFSNDATAEAGDAQSICIVEGDETVQLAGSIGGGATSSTWISSGTGSFDDNTSVNAVYTPSAADITAGSVTLTLTTNDPAGPCDAASDTVVISFSNDATAEAGDAQSICIVEGDETVQLAGSIGGGATSSTWISSGTGSFDDNTSVNAVYTPSAADITAGSVTLTLTTNDPAGPCDAASDTVVISFSNDATAEAGDAQSICIVEGDETVQLAGSIGGGATSSTWISSGTGSFDDNTSVNAVYTPSAADITAGSVTLTLTTNDPVGPCDAASSDVRIILNTPPVVSIQPVEPVCVEETVQLIASPPGGTFSGTGVTASGLFSPTSEESYTITYTYSDGICENSTTLIIVGISCQVAEGCTLGYWKTHTDRWCDEYQTCTLYGDVFENAPLALANLTLLEVLNLGGGGINNLGRQSVAALLNTCSEEVDYYYTDQMELIAYVNNNFSRSLAGAAGTYLDELNNAGCPLGGTQATSEPSEDCETDTPDSGNSGDNGIPGKGNGSVAISGFSAYPVPFKETLNIQYEFDYVSPATIQFFDMRGRLLRSIKELKATRGVVTTIDIDYSMRPSQTYIVTVTTDREVITKQIVSSK